MKKLITITLALMMLLSCFGCGSQKPAVETDPVETTQPVQTTTAPEQATTQPPQTEPQDTAENPANYIQLSISDAEGNYVSLTAYDDGEGSAYVEYVGEVKKVGTFDLSVLQDITAALEEAGLPQLNGQNVYEDGPESASMYVTYADGSYLGAGYSGKIPKEFTDGYAAMDTYFQQLVTDLPVYIPQPVVMGEVDEAALAELQQILASSGVEPLDMFSITDAPADYFLETMGLSDATGVTRGTCCSPMMMAVAYSFVIATVENEDAIPRVAQDFSQNIDWNRWVCVSADHALIAKKGNMVLCLVGSNDLYSQTAQAILECGWTEIETLDR